MAISSYHSGGAAASSAAGAGPVAVGRFVAPVAGKALSGGGAVMAALLSNWAAISGPALAACTMPAKMTRAAPEPGCGGASAPSLLHLKVAPARALDVQYAVPQLIERINQALGYRAVAGIRLIQAPAGIRPKNPSAAPKPMPAAETPAGTSRLASALARMAAGLKSRQPGSV